MFFKFSNNGYSKFFTHTAIKWIYSHNSVLIGCEVFNKLSQLLDQKLLPSVGEYKIIACKTRLTNTKAGLLGFNRTQRVSEWGSLTERGLCKVKNYFHDDTKTWFTFCFQCCHLHWWCWGIGGSSELSLSGVKVLVLARPRLAAPRCGVCCVPTAAHGAAGFM